MVVQHFQGLIKLVLLILKNRNRLIAVDSGDSFALKMKFVDHIYDDQIVDRLTVKIILPEGTS